MYDVELGRFISRDPIGYRGGINLFEYVKSAPTKFVDPRGYRLTVLGTPAYQATVLATLNTLCPAGKWVLVGGNVQSSIPNFCNSTSSFVSTPWRATGICPSRQPSLGYWVSHSRGCESAATPLSCCCLCDAITDTWLGADKQIKLIETGTLGPNIPSGDDKGGWTTTGIMNVWSVWTDFVRNPTPPLVEQSHDGSTNLVPSKSFMNLGHEICGHAVPAATGMSAIETENKLRREHGMDPRTGSDH